MYMLGLGKKNYIYGLFVDLKIYFVGVIGKVFLRNNISWMEYLFGMELFLFFVWRWSVGIVFI